MNAADEKRSHRNLFMRQQTKRRFSSVQLPEPFLRLTFRHRIPIPTSFCLLAEQVKGLTVPGAGLGVIDTATAEMCGQVIYPAALMKNSAVPDAALAFLDYLKGEEAMKVFEGIGFSAVPAK